MFQPAFPRPFLLLTVTLLCGSALLAQRQGGGRAAPASPAPAPAVSAPRPQAPVAAPRPSAPTAAPRPAAPMPTAAPRPTYTPPVSAPSTPRPTYTPPTSVPNRPAPVAPTPRSPGVSSPGSTSPGYTPRQPIGPTTTSQPRPTGTPRGFTPTTRGNSGGAPTLVPQPTLPDTGGTTGIEPRSNPRPVGGSVRGTGTPAPTLPTTPGNSPRGLYDRGGAGAGVATPVPTLNNPGAADSRYRPRAGGTALPQPTAGGNAPTVNQRGGTAGGIGALPRGNLPRTVDRYGSGGDIIGPRPLGTGSAGAGGPTLRPRTTTPTATPGAPRLNPRPATPTVTPRYQTPTNLAGACYGPVYDPYWSSCYTPCNPYYRYGGWGGWYGGIGYGGWCGGLGWTIGIGWGSFGWGFSNWYPLQCWGTYGWYGSWYGSYWDTWCRPGLYSSYWWWPGSIYCPVGFYAPAAYSSVVLVETNRSTAPAEETIVVGSPIVDRSMAPADLARRYVQLGDFYFREGRFGEAAETYARARTYAPNDPTIHFVLADAVFANGDYHFAAFLIAEALRLDPAMATADTDKRLCYGDVGKFEQQMQALRDYLAAKPYDAMAHLVLGYNLKFSGKPGEAEQAFLRVQQIDPPNTAARLFLEALAAAKAAAAAAPAAPGAPAPIGGSVERK